MRKLTAEQRAKADARKAQFRQFIKKVADMTEVERAELGRRMAGVVTADGGTLSLRNLMLIFLQHSGATVVGGFRQWLKHGRCVRKGEHGMMIWVPTVRGGQKTEGEPAPSENPEAQSELRFLIGTVFDISQTEEINGAVSEQTATQNQGELIAA